MSQCTQTKSPLGAGAMSSVKNMSSFFCKERIQIQSVKYKNEFFVVIRAKGFARKILLHRRNTVN